MMIPEDQPFDLDVWNIWASIPLPVRPVLTLEWVLFQKRLLEWLRVR